MIRIEFTSEEIEALHYERFHYPAPRVQLKMEALYLKSQGLPHGVIQSLCKISSVTLAEYLRQYISGGVERLKVNLHKGKYYELQPHQESLRELFMANPPRSTKEAALIIKEHTGIERKLTQVRELMKRMGFKYRKVAAVPGKVASSDLAEKQDQFKTDELEPRLEEAKNGKRDVFFDAAHFVHGAFLGCLWSSERLYIPTPAGRNRFNVLGALNAVTKAVVSIENTDYINSRSVCELLLKLKQRSVGIPITAVLDNARYQACSCVREYAEAIGIELLFLPPYSPNLNLIERLWKFVKKKYLNSIYYPKFTDFCSAIRDSIEPTVENLRELETLLTLNFQSFSKVKISTVYSIHRLRQHRS